MVSSIGQTDARAAVEVSDLLRELKVLRSTSPDRVLSLDASQLTKFGAGTRRPYALILFLTASQVLDHPQLKLRSVRREFGYAAQAVARGSNPDAAFFVEVMYEKAPTVFQALKAQAVPYIVRIPGSLRLSLSQELVLPDSDRMTFETAGFAGYPWRAEDMLGYFSRSSKLEAGPIVRPTLLRHPLFPLLAPSVVGVIAVLAWRLWTAGVVHHPLPWAAGSLAVFWFAVSGGMYNIIRGVPLFMRDREGRLQFFMAGRGSQLGAEGFIVGSGYLAFSCMVSLLTYAAPKIQHKALRNVTSYGLVALASYLLLRLFLVYQSKTNYRISSYLF